MPAHLGYKASSYNVPVTDKKSFLNSKLQYISFIQGAYFKEHDNDKEKQA